MVSRVLLASLAIALLEISAASATSITNRDDRDHTITIVEGDAKQDHILKSTQSIDGVCLKGCVVILNGDENDQYELEGSEIVSIEDGILYDDGPDVPGAPPSGNQGSPSPDTR